MSHIPADLTREEGEILAALFRNPNGFPADWWTPEQLTGLIRRGFMAGQDSRWVVTDAGVAVGRAVFDEWFGGRS